MPPVPACGAYAEGSYSADNFGTATNNVNVSANDSPGTAFNVNTLRFNTDNTTLTLPTGLSYLNAGGILVTPAANTNGVTIGGTGTLSGNATANREVIVQDYGKLALNVPIVDNGGGNGRDLRRLRHNNRGRA